MRSNSHIQRPFFFAYALISLAAIFYLPYLVPMHPSASASYVFGYNNRAGVALLLVLVAIGSVWTKGLGLRPLSESDAKPVSRRALTWSLTAVLLGCVLMYLLVGRSGGFIESSYGIDRAWHASLGQIPYVNFEFAYGPSLLYGPLLLRHLLPITLVQAYYLFWLLNWVLGTLLLYAVLNMVDYPTSSRGSIFLLIYGAGFSSVIFMGTNYTSLRYTCPLFFILVVDRLLKRGGDRSSIYAAVVAVVFTIVLLSLSPETAIAFAFACICIFLLLTPRWSALSASVLAALVCALALVFWLALKIHVLDTLKGFGEGAFNFPVFLAPHIVLFFGAAFVCGCYVFRRLADRGMQDNTIGLVAFSIPMVAAALGRCDPFHTFWNGEGIFIASMFYLSNYRAVWKWYRMAFVGVLVILPLGYALRCAQKAISYSIAETSNHPSFTSRSVAFVQREYISGLASPATKVRWQRHPRKPARIVPDTIPLAVLYPAPHGKFLAPWGYQPNGTYLSNEIDYGYFDGFVNANTVNAVRTKLAEMEDHPDQALLLPKWFEDTCTLDTRAVKTTMITLFSFPYFGKVTHPESIQQPVCSYILAHYRLESAPGPQNFNYGLWVHNSSQPPR